MDSITLRKNFAVQFLKSGTQQCFNFQPGLPKQIFSPAVLAFFANGEDLKDLSQALADSTNQ
jgi:hypothetical protein